jgi:hypothetical protein
MRVVTFNGSPELREFQSQVWYVRAALEIDSRSMVLRHVPWRHQIVYFLASQQADDCQYRQGKVIQIVDSDRT